MKQDGSIIEKILLILLSLAILFPFIYLFSSSLFSNKDFINLRFFPSKLNFSNYQKAMELKNVRVALFNSIVISILTSVIRSLFVVFASFAFTHYNFKGKKVLFIILVLTLFIPQDTLLYHNYKTIVSLGLLDTHLGVALPSFFSASQMVLIYAYFISLGKEYYDNASLDGAGDFRYIFSILFPLSSPIIITLIIQTLVTSFNSYLWPLLVTNKVSSRTIQVSITMLDSIASGNKGVQFAIIALLTIPFILLLSIFKNRIENSLIRR